MMKKRHKKPWSLMEDNIAQDINGKTTKGSGSVYGNGDIEAEYHIVEAKFRGKKSFTIKIDDLDKITKQSRALCKTPILVYQNDDNRRICVMNYNDLFTWLKYGGNK